MAAERSALRHLSLANAVSVAGAELLDAEVQAAMNFARNSRAASTERLYQHDWRDFSNWCADRNVSALPAQPELVAIYLAARAASLRTSTLERRLAAIVVEHRRRGEPFDRKHPILAEVWRGIRRTLGTAKKGKAPLAVDSLIEMVRALPITTAGRRDRALLLVGYAGAFRRTELVGIDLSDLTFTGQGLIIRMRRGKADQEGRGDLRAIPHGENQDTCPVAALKSWLLAAGVTEGAVFRAVDRFGRVASLRLSDKAVARIIQKTAYSFHRRSGVTADEAERRSKLLAGHSLRAGFATSAAVAGCDEWAIMRQTGHKRKETVKGYIRISSLFKANAAARLGL
jgi:site-specific recombinase XerD